MPSYDIYDTSGNRVGELRSRGDHDYDGSGLDDTRERRVNTGAAWVFLLITSLFTWWAASFLLRYGGSFFYSSGDGGWTGKARMFGPYNADSFLWGIVVMVFALIYAFVGLINLVFSVDTGLTAKDGFARMLIMGIPNGLIIYLGIKSGVGWFWG